MWRPNLCLECWSRLEQWIASKLWIPHLEHSSMQYMPSRRLDDYCGRRIFPNFLSRTNRICNETAMLAQHSPLLHLVEHLVVQFQLVNLLKWLCSRSKSLSRVNLPERLHRLHHMFERFLSSSDTHIAEKMIDFFTIFRTKKMIGFRSKKTASFFIFLKL